MENQADKTPNRNELRLSQAKGAKDDQHARQPMNQREYALHTAKLKSRIAQAASRKSSEDRSAIPGDKDADGKELRQGKDLAPPEDDQSLRRTTRLHGGELGEAMFGTNSLQDVAVEIETIERCGMTAEDITSYLQLDTKLQEKENRKKCYGFSDAIPDHISKCKINDINTILFRIMGDQESIISDLAQLKEDKISQIQRWVMKLKEDDNDHDRWEGSTFRQLVGHDVWGISVLNKDQDQLPDRALSKSKATKVPRLNLEVVYNRGQKAPAHPTKPGATQMQQASPKPANFPKFCTKANMWSQLPAWQEFVRMISSFDEEMAQIGNLHSFFYKMCSNAQEQFPKNGDLESWPQATDIDAEWKHTLDELGLTVARDLVTGVEVSGTTNPIKW